FLESPFLYGINQPTNLVDILRQLRPSSDQLNTGIQGRPEAASTLWIQLAQHIVYQQDRTNGKSLSPRSHDSKRERQCDASLLSIGRVISRRLSLHSEQKVVPMGPSACALQNLIPLPRLF